MKPIRFPTRLARALALAATFSFGTEAASAQSHGQRPVRVALPNEFPSADARALIVRAASPEKGDVVVLKETDLAPETLVAAVALLRHLRKSAPPADEDVVVSVKSFAPLERGDPRVIARLAAVLAQLRAQPLVRIGNLGPGRWIDLPEAALSGT